jgi:hypothetical protein
MNFFTKFYQIFQNTRFEKENEKLDKKESYAKTNLRKNYMFDT